MKTIFNHTLLNSIVLVLVLAACKSTTRNREASIDSVVHRSFQSVVSIPADTSHEAYVGIAKKATVGEFYSLRQGQPAWPVESKLSLSDSLMRFLSDLKYYGLPESRYHLAELQSLSSPRSDIEKIKRDLLLTDALLLLAEELKTGISAGESGVDSVGLVLLNDVLTNGNLSRALRSQEPTYSGYKELKVALKIVVDDETIGERRLDSVELIRVSKLIAINLERWRKENSTREGRLVWVNIPSFNLDVVQEDSVIFSSRVIVGKPSNTTPVLTSKIECISIYPYWTVPRKISVEEYLPVIKRDTAFITRNNFDVLDRKGNILDADSVPWHKFNKNYFPVVLRQREGPENSLGIIKFVFDNPYAVFLHDTNAKRLFNNRKRALSHGCVRVERAVDLAHLLVTGRTAAKSPTLNKYLSEKQRRFIDLKDPVPIHLRYFTCEFRNGTFYEYDDIYKLDQELYTKLFGAEVAVL